MSLSSAVNVLKNLFKTIFELDKSIIIRFYLAIAISIIGLVCSAMTPLFLREIINSLESENILFYSILFLLISYGLVWTIGQIMSTIVCLIWQAPSNKIANRICEKTLAHILKFPIDFYSKNDSRIAISSIEKTFQIIPSIFSSIIIYVIPSIGEMIFTLIIFFYTYSFKYGLLLVLLFLGFIFMTIYSVHIVREVDKDYHKKLQNLSIHVSEVINNFETVKSFSAEEYETNSVKKMLSKFEITSKKRSFYLDGAQVLQTLLSGLILISFTCLSGYAVCNGKMKAGDFVMINSYFIQFAIPITWLGYTFAELYRSISSLSETFKIQQTIVPKKPEGKDMIFEDNKTGIFFKNISLISDEKKILNNVSFEIESGKRLAIVGASGSGKSTCIRLLLRLIESYDGEIFIGDNNIKEINQSCLLNQISIVLQDAAIFYGTIRENIIYNTKNISDERLNEIIKLTKLEKLINSLPNGIDTNIEDIILSGGEKQRITLARALIRNPKIFIFDEPTSALDNHNEIELKESIEILTKGKTTIMISHRLPIIIDFDLIIVFKNGKIVEKGNHKELIEKNGIYANLWNEQICSV